MPEIDLTLLGEVIEEYERAPHGQKQKVLATRLPTLGISEGTFFRWRARCGRRDYERKTPTTRGLLRSPERLECCREIMRLKYSGPKGVRSRTTADAISLAVQWGRVPKEAAAVPEGSYNRLARQMRLRKEPRRGVRWEAPYFNYLHQVDASGSEHFYPHHLENGEWVLKLRPKPQKNKPIPEGRQRLWYWGLADDFSGCRIARVVVAPGESALDGLDFLQFAWCKEQAHAPLRGIPLILYTDNGVLARHHAVRRFAKGCAVTIRAHEPERSQATGKVETGWRDFWKRFESLFMALPDWRTREIKLSDVQQRLQWFVRSSNQRDHRHLPRSKEEAWLASVRRRGGLVDIDPGAFAQVFRDFRRTLDDAGVFDFQGSPYQVKEIQACPVIVYQQLTREGAPALLVEDRRDGRRYPAQPFVIPAASDWKTVAHTPLENLLKDDPWKDTRPPLPDWSPGTPLGKALPANVRVLTPRAAAVRESGFEMPEAHRLEAGATGKSLEELAAGVEVIDRSIDRSTDQEYPRFANSLERYEFLIQKIGRGDDLLPEEGEFLTWFRGEYAEMLNLLAAPRARLAVVE